MRAAESAHRFVIRFVFEIGTTSDRSFHDALAGDRAEYSESSKRVAQADLELPFFLRKDLMDLGAQDIHRDSVLQLGPAVDPAPSFVIPVRVDRKVLARAQ